MEQKDTSEQSGGITKTHIKYALYLVLAIVATIIAVVLYNNYSKKDSPKSGEEKPARTNIFSAITKTDEGEAGLENLDMSLQTIIKSLGFLARTPRIFDRMQKLAKEYENSVSPNAKKLMKYLETYKENQITKDIDFIVSLFESIKVLVFE